jgi:hypothetical protein
MSIKATDTKVPTDCVLQRLENVRQTGAGRWVARCPAHDDRSPSLSIRELDDGVVLLHDFGGCNALSVVQAIGLEFADLFPTRRIWRIDPLKRPRLSATDALVALSHEITVAILIITDFVEHREIDEPAWERLALACRRIGSARTACCTRAGS